MADGLGLGDGEFDVVLSGSVMTKGRHPALNDTLGALVKDKHPRAQPIVVDGPPVIKSENARPNGWTYVDINARDLGSYVADAQRVVAESLELPAGYSLAWSGQYE